MSIIRETGKQGVLYPCSGTFSQEETKVLIHATMRMNLENTRLNYRSHTHKFTYPKITRRIMFLNLNAKSWNITFRFQGKLRRKKALAANYRPFSKGGTEGI